MILPAIWRISGARGRPIVCSWIVSTTCVQIAATTEATPDDHLAISPDSRMVISRRGCIGHRCGCPAIGVRIVPRATVETPTHQVHPRQSSHCLSRLPLGIPGCRCVSGAVLSNYSYPDYIFRRCSSRMNIASRRPKQSFRFQSTPRYAGRPAGASIVSVAVQLSVLGYIGRRCAETTSVVPPAPDHHLTASPYCSVAGSRRGRLG